MWHRLKVAEVKACFTDIQSVSHRLVNSPVVVGGIVFVPCYISLTMQCGAWCVTGKLNDKLVNQITKLNKLAVKCCYVSRFYNLSSSVVTVFCTAGRAHSPFFFFLFFFLLIYTMLILKWEILFFHSHYTQACAHTHTCTTAMPRMWTSILHVPVHIIL